MGKIEYKNMKKLRSDIEKLLKKERYRIRWDHIKKKHPGIRKRDLLHCLRAGYIRPDSHIKRRYVAWVRIRGKLMRSSFEVRRINGKLLLIITAFWEEK